MMKVPFFAYQPSPVLPIIQFVQFVIPKLDIFYNTFSISTDSLFVFLHTSGT